MAEWRKLHMSISVSRRFNSMLSSHKYGELAQLLYALGVAHLDDYGRLPGDITVYKLTVYPASYRSLIDIEHALELQEKCNLIIWNKQQGIIQYEESDFYQPIGHRRKNSKYPEIKRSGKISKNPDLFKIDEPEELPKRKKKTPEEIPFDIEKEFDNIWGQYPFKDGRKEAYKHFRASVKTEKDLKDIQAALDNYKKHLDLHVWKNVKSGKTWFNNWRDWIPEIKEKKNKSVDNDVMAKCKCGHRICFTGKDAAKRAENYVCDECKKKESKKNG